MPLKILENVPLAPLTTLNVGGPARFFAVALTEENVLEAFDFAESNGHDVFVLGGGSNILVADEGFGGLVLQIGSKGISINHEIATENNLILCAAAGEEWDALVAYCVGNDLAGVECLSGIPGFVGGTPVQNVGAYGQEVSETIVAVRCFDRNSKEIVEMTNDECGFEYRKSIFNSTHRDRYVVLSVTFRFERGGVPKLVYKDLREYFGSVEPTLPQVREAVLKIRRSKSMVIEDGDSNFQSAGSFFKNPIVTQARFEEIVARFESVPHFPAGNGKVKIPAAWLIEKAGFQKGSKMGNAGISTNHTLAIINCGGATAAEIIALKNRIQIGVLDNFGIELITEPVFVGFS